MFVDRCLSFWTFSFAHCVVIRILIAPLVSSNSSYLPFLGEFGYDYFHTTDRRSCLEIGAGGSGFSSVYTMIDYILIPQVSSAVDTFDVYFFYIIEYKFEVEFYC